MRLATFGGGNGVAQHPFDGRAHIGFLAERAIGEAAFALLIERHGFLEQRFLAAEGGIDALTRCPSLRSIS